MPVFENDGDRASFLELIEEEVNRFNWRCYAYCLISLPDTFSSDGKLRFFSLLTGQFRDNRVQICQCILPKLH